MFDKPALASITIYPVKSCQGTSLASVEVVATGLAGDREWQVVDENGDPLTQETKRQMAVISPEIIDGGLRISAPGHKAVEVESGVGSATVAKTLFAVPTPVLDAGDAAAELFTSVIDIRARLVTMAPKNESRPPTDYDIFERPVKFAGAAPVHVTSQTSLEWLTARASEPFDGTRFRPNLVVGGTPAWVEDTWGRFRIGDAELEAIVPWPRCPVTQVDQVTGERHKEPAKILKAYRWCTNASSLSDTWRPIVEGSSLFGLGCTIEFSGTTISVGDRVEVLSTTSPMIPAPVE